MKGRRSRTHASEVFPVRIHELMKASLHVNNKIDLLFRAQEFQRFILNCYEVASASDELEHVSELGLRLIFVHTLQSDADQLVVAALPNDLAYSAPLREGVHYALRPRFRKENLVEEIKHVKHVALPRHIGPRKNIKGTQGKVEVPQALEVPHLQSRNHRCLPNNTPVSCVYAIDY